jgi:hypothetical protein
MIAVVAANLLRAISAVVGLSSGAEVAAGKQLPAVRSGRSNKPPASYSYWIHHK